MEYFLLVLAALYGIIGFLCGRTSRDDEFDKTQAEHDAALRNKIAMISHWQRKFETANNSANSYSKTNEKLRKELYSAQQDAIQQAANAKMFQATAQKHETALVEVEKKNKALLLDYHQMSCANQQLGKDLKQSADMIGNLLEQVPVRAENGRFAPKHR